MTKSPMSEGQGVLAPGQSAYWSSTGWRRDQAPQMDARVTPTFPEGVTYTGIGQPFWYGDFRSQLESTDFLGNDVYTYFWTVRNDGTDTAAYVARIWWP